MRKKFIGMVILILLGVGITGYFGHKTLLELLNTVKEESIPNQHLQITQNILFDLQIAENSINTYILTKDPDDLVDYSRTLTTIDKQLEEVFSFHLDDREYQQQIMLLRNVIEKKYLLMSQFIELKNDTSTEAVFNKVFSEYDRLQSESDSIDLAEFSKDTLGHSEKRRTKILGKLVERLRIHFSALSKDTLKLETTQLSEPSIADIIQQIRKGQRVESSRLALEELKLIEQDKRLKKAISEIVTKLEKIEEKQSAQRAENAEVIYTKSETIISVIFIIFLVVLAILVLIILNDLNQLKNRRIQLEIERKKAIKLADAKSEFLSRMSHELRTPLNSIIGFSEQLRSRIQLPENLQLIEPVVFASKHLHTIVNDILDFSKIEAGKLEFEKIAFQPAHEVIQVINLFEQTVSGKNIELISEIQSNKERIVTGDPVRYRQVLINLISNAVKFTETGTVKVKIEYLNDNELITSVSDTGIGIRSEKLDLIFESFSQAETNTTRRFGGTGLGLSISKRIVELQKGKIKVTSEEGKGSLFTFSLPFSPGKFHSSEINYVRPMFSGKKVLIIDDEEFNCRLFSMMLGGMDMEVRTSNKLDTTLSVLKTFQPNIIFMDINMADINGHDLLKRIRKDQLVSLKVPVIAATGGVSEIELKEIELSGFEGFLEKPYVQDKVEHILWQFFSQTGNTDLGILDGVPVNLDEGIKELLRISGGSSEFVLDLMELFKKSFEKDLDKIELFFKNEDYEMVRQRAHALCSSAKQLKLKSFYLTLKRIETFASESSRLSKNEIETDIKLLHEYRLLLIPEIERKIEIFKEKNIEL